MAPLKPHLRTLLQGEQDPLSRTASRGSGRTVRSSLGLLGLSSALLLGACASSTEPPPPTDDGPTDDARTARIELEAGTVIEVAYASIKDGKQAQLFGEYFPQVMPIAMEYGGKSLGMFQVQRTLEGSDRPQIIALFEWPNVDAFLSLHRDPRFLSIVGVRDDALSYMDNANFYVVDKTTTLTVREGQSYDLWSGWTGQDGPGRVERELKAVQSSAQSKSGSDTVTLHAVDLAPTIGAEVAASCPANEEHGIAFADVVTISALGGMDSDGEAARTLQHTRSQLATRSSRHEAQFAFPPRAQQ